MAGTWSTGGVNANGPKWISEGWWPPGPLSFARSRGAITAASGAPVSEANGLRRCVVPTPEEGSCPSDSYESVPQDDEVLEIGGPSSFL